MAALRPRRLREVIGWYPISNQWLFSTCGQGRLCVLPHLGLCLFWLFQSVCGPALDRPLRLDVCTTVVGKLERDNYKTHIEPIWLMQGWESGSILKQCKSYADSNQQTKKPALAQ